MKTPQVYHRILLISALLLGMVGALRADVTNPNIPALPQGSRVEKKTGVFSRLFGRKAERVDGANQNDNDDDDDDDEDQRSRPRIPQSQFPPPAPGTTISTTTKRAPILSTAPGADRSSRVQKGTRSIAASTSGPSSVSREVQPASPPLAPSVPPAKRNPRVQDPTRTAGVPSTVQAPPASKQLSPPLSKNLAPSDVRDDTPSLPQPSQPVPSASLPTSPREAPAPLRAPVASLGAATSSTSSSSVAEQNSAPVLPSQGPQSAPPPNIEPPASASLPPFGTPVPGRPGFAYPPGQEATPKNMIDVSGYAPGTKVRDPDSKVVFRVP